MEVDLHLPACRSLKDKRQVIRPILDGSRRRFQVAAAEVGVQDRWQRARLGFAYVSGDGRHLHEVLAKVEGFVASFPEVEIIGVERATLVVDE